MKNLSTKHRLMMHRLILGEKATNIAKDLNMSDSTFSIIRNSPLFKAELDRLTRINQYNTIRTATEVSDKINAAAPIAADKLIDKMDSDDERISLKSIEKVIEFSDFGSQRASEANKPIVINQQQMTLIEEGLEE